MNISHTNGEEKSVLPPTSTAELRLTLSCLWTPDSTRGILGPTLQTSESQFPSSALRQILIGGKHDDVKEVTETYN